MSFTLGRLQLAEPVSVTGFEPSGSISMNLVCTQLTLTPIALGSSIHPSTQSTKMRLPSAMPMFLWRRVRSISAVAAARDSALPPLTYLSRSAKRSTSSF